MAEHQDERRSHPGDRMTVEQQAVDIVGGKYKWKRPSEAEFREAQFTGGDPVKKPCRHYSTNSKENLMLKKLRDYRRLLIAA